jgi:hypothetical protein
MNGRFLHCLPSTDDDDDDDDDDDGSGDMFYSLA